jgi:energy-coupling factor transport system substrate-specific component
MDSAGWLRVLIGLLGGTAAAWVTSAVVRGWFLPAVVAIVVGTVLFAALESAQAGRRGARAAAVAVVIGAVAAVIAQAALSSDYAGALLGVVAGIVAYAIIDFIWARRLVAARFAIAFVVFLTTAGLWILAFGDFGGIDPDSYFSSVSVDSFALILAVSMLVGVVVFFALEYLQTGQLASVAGQFGTRTLVLMPAAIAINIVLGATVANAIKLPIYLDSIGTILVGVVAGPIAGALTGFLANLLWTYVIPAPFQYGPAAAFAVVAAMIGLLAGLFSRAGALRPRPNRSVPELLAAAVVALLVVGALAWYAYDRFYAGPDPIPLFTDQTDPAFLILRWVTVVLVAATAIGFAALLVVRRDLTVASVALAGVLTGTVAALMSAPIAANVFGGITGSGVDFLVAAFRQAGSDIQTATLQQGLLVDPFDKMISYFVVYLVVLAMATRFKARFPQGDRLIPETAGPGEVSA